jgi:hypothetical protein
LKFGCAFGGERSTKMADTLTGYGDDQPALLAAGDMDEDNFTELQEELYVPESDTQGNRERFYSQFCYIEKIVAYSSQITRHMDCTQAPVNRELSPAKYTYDVDCQFSKLRNIFATYQFPVIKVAEPYVDLVEISLSPNFMHNFFINAELIIDAGKNKFSQRINTIFMDIYRGRDEDDVDFYDRCIGNRKTLVNWSSELKTNKQLFMPLPYFIDQTDKYAIPTHMYQNKGNIKVVCTFDRDMKKYIQMRVKYKDKWRILPVPELSFLDLNGGKGKMPIPELWARHSLIAKEEMEEEKKSGVMIDIIDYEYFEDTVASSKIKLSINREDAALRGIRYGLLNYKAALLNNHSNYSTNHKNPMDGDDPEESHRFVCGQNDRIPLRDSIHSSLIPGFYSCRRGGPDKHLFHDIHWDLYPYAYGPDSTIVPRNNCLMISLTAPPKAPNQIVRTDTAYSVPDKTAKIIFDATNPEQRIEELMKHIEASTDKRLLDNSPTNMYIFKGYVRTAKKIQFKVGDITVIQ